MLKDWDSATVAAGSFPCVYTEGYVDELDVQGVSRSILTAREAVDDYSLAVGTEVTIETVDGRVLGPYQVETFQPEGPVVTLGLGEIA